MTFRTTAVRRNAVPLTMALSGYDHASAVTTGEVEIAGAEPSFVSPASPHTLEEFIASDWDAADVPAVPYLVHRVSGEDAVVALPVFLSRGFRHGCVLVREDRIGGAEDLRGATFAAADRSSAVFAVGALSDGFGVDPSGLAWRDVNSAGDADVDGLLVELLVSGEVDAVIAERPHQALAMVPSGEPVGRLFKAPADIERAYFAQTGVFPILRVLAVRRKLLEEHPWLATNIYRAFEIARRRYFTRLSDIRASRVPVPAVVDHYRMLRHVFGADLWPYGVQANLPTLAALVRYASEQGLLPADPPDPAGFFAPIESFVDGI